MRELQQITLPSGTVAHIVRGWTFEEYLRLEAALHRAAAAMRMKDGKPDSIELKGEAITEVNRLRVRLAVRRLTAADGTDLPVNEEHLFDRDWKDGAALIEAAEAIDPEMEKKLLGQG